MCAYIYIIAFKLLILPHVFVHFRIKCKFHEFFLFPCVQCQRARAMLWKIGRVPWQNYVC